MSKHKGDIEIGVRAAEEAIRCCKTGKVAAERLGFERKIIHSWHTGGTPGGLALARLHCLGADVLYILTGERTGQKTGSDHNCGTK